MPATSAATSTATCDVHLMNFHASVSGPAALIQDYQAVALASPAWAVVKGATVSAAFHIQLHPPT